MSLSKEAKIGLLVTISLVIFFAGFYFLKGADLFSGEKEYYCFYDNVDGLQTSSVVQVRGLNVGRVSRTVLVDNKGVRVVIAVRKGVELPVGTKAMLASDNLLAGSKMIRLDLGNGPGIIDPKSNLESGVESGVLGSISTQIDPLLKDVRSVITNLDSVLTGASAIVGDDNQREIASAIASLNVSMKNISTLSASLKEESGEIKSVIHNANTITTNIAGNNDNINKILTNFSATSDQLSKAPIQSTFQDLQKAVNGLQGIVNKINNNEGSLGALVNDKALYTNLNSTLSTVNALMADINAHPSRYINITVFGKKKDK